jgi:hypothetical protein
MRAYRSFSLAAKVSGRRGCAQGRGLRPAIGARFIGADDTSYEPLVALTGQWDFHRPQVAALDGSLVSGGRGPAGGAAG